MSTGPFTPPPRRPKGPPIPEHLVEAYFDHELDEGSRERLFRSMLADPRSAELMARTQRAIGLLREPVEAPDLSAAILARVERRREFLPSGLRRLVTAGRLAIAASLLIGVLAIALTQRWSPGTLDLAPKERPVAAVVEAGRSEAAEGARNLAEAIESLTERIGPVLEMRRRMVEETRVADGGLTPGELQAVRPLRERSSSLAVPMGSGGLGTDGAPVLARDDQFAAERFPLATIIRDLGGRWAWPGGPGEHACDRVFLMPGDESGSAGERGGDAEDGDQSGGDSPRR